MKTLAGQLKSGDILGAIQTVLQTVSNVVKTLSEAGIIHLGSTSATPRARGGPVVPGRTYLVGENGPEYVRVGSPGYVTPNKQSTGAARVQIVPSPYFDAVVQGHAAKVAGPMAGQAAVMGAAGGMAGMDRRRSRQIP
jgi:hypothetical protein